MLAGSLYVENIMLHADPFHSYCVAIVVPAQAALEEWAKGANILYSTFPDLCSNKEAVKEVLSSISKVIALDPCDRSFKLAHLRIELSSYQCPMFSHWDHLNGVAFHTFIVCLRYYTLGKPTCKCTNFDSCTIFNSSRELLP